ncbi:MAG TPA: S9 family peptidase [Thermomicrobiales bacterium]|nr:S9 family peptidase [Thermomicrobiales bacterium]
MTQESIRTTESRIVSGQALSDANDLGIRATDVAKRMPDVPVRRGRSIAIDDLYRATLPGNPQVSPDGTRVVAPVLTIDRDADEYRSTLWNIPLSGDDPTPLTSGRWNDSSPRWSPDGKWIAFLSNRDGKNKQLFLLPADIGEARQITRFENDVTEFEWAPDSDRLVVTSAIATDQGDDPDIMIIDAAYYKHDGKGFLRGKHSHIFTVRISASDEEPVQLTDGLFHHSQPVWSPDGEQIAFIANREPDADISGTDDIWLISARGGAPRRLTDGTGTWNAMAWSPDGGTIAAIGNTGITGVQTSIAHCSGLYRIHVSDGATEQIDTAFDRVIGDGSMSGPNGEPGVPLRWLPDGSAIDCLVADRGSTVVIRFPTDGSTPIQLTGHGRHITAFDHISDDELVIATTEPTTPAELHRITPTDETPLTDFNAAWINDVYVSTPEEFWFESNGEAIQGWLLRPDGNTPDSEPVPLILNIHGGPWAQFSSGWFHELQLFVAQGNALVMVNPRGSSGRSRNFMQQIGTAWGEADMPDFMGAVDHALGLGGLDANRLGVTGGSYGGFGTNWLLGHTDRFKAAVTDRSICNLVSMAGTDDVTFSNIYREFGDPWETADRYWELSPLRYVGNVTTPCLIIHSEEDHRCPMEQAEQWFTALKKLGVPTRFIRFANESHGLGRNGKPTHRVERLKHTLGWFEQYL